MNDRMPDDWRAEDAQFNLDHYAQYLADHPVYPDVQEEDDPDQSYYSVAEAAAHLGMSDSGIRRMIQRGKLKAERAGARLWLIKRGDLAGIRRSRAGRPRKPKP